MAAYTNRNIISVPLSQIGTNQQLQDIVFDQMFKVACRSRYQLHPASAVLLTHGTLLTQLNIQQALHSLGSRLHAGNWG